MDISVPLSEYSQIDEITCYHEAGHAVIARLLGRQVYHIAFDLNVENTYNGRIVWGREEFYRDWDSNIPLEEALKELKHPLWQTPRVKTEQLPSVKQQIEDFAVKLLEHKVCWQAVEAVAKTLFKNLQEEPGRLTNAQTIIAEVFKKAALEEKNP